MKTFLYEQLVVSAITFDKMGLHKMYKTKNRVIPG